MSKVTIKTYVTGTLDGGEPHLMSDISIKDVFSECPLPHWQLVNTTEIEIDDIKLKALAKRADEIAESK